jgi:hypothetical protein
MSFESFTATLNASEFPFVTDFFERTVLIPGIDNPPRNPKAVYGQQENANYEIAQHFYCQNIMPSSEGILSAGYQQLVPALLGSVDFDQAFTLRDSAENNFIFVPGNGKNYIYTANSGAWKSTNPVLGIVAGTLVSRSYVNGRTFICYQRNAIYEYNNGAATFLPIAFTGVDVTTIDVIGNSNNYLLWASNITVGWSSLINPTDLTANINTGAGSAIPQDVKGPIRCIAPITGGFILYTTKNAVAAFYTNNARAPFVFREVPNAGGVQNPTQVTVDGTLGFHFAWTTNGLQKITMNSADPVSNAATDFLAGRIIESFDLTALTLSVQRLNSDLLVKVAFVAGRYLVVSYGVTTFTHAIVYDLTLKRWGKLRVDHVCCISYPYPNLIGSVSNQPPKQTLAFLQRDGTIQLVVMDYRFGADQGVLVLGKYQLVRQQVLRFQTIELENVQVPYPPDVYVINSLDGRNLQTPAKLTLMLDGGGYKKYGAPVTGAPVGKNLSFLFVGTFEFSTALITITKGGSR